MQSVRACLNTLSQSLKCEDVQTSPYLRATPQYSCARAKGHTEVRTRALSSGTTYVYTSARTWRCERPGDYAQTPLRNTPYRDRVHPRKACIAEICTRETPRMTLTRNLKLSVRCTSESVSLRLLRTVIVCPNQGSYRNMYARTRSRIPHTLYISTRTWRCERLGDYA